MNDNKGQTIFLSVIGIATLLVAIIGATFAYFTTTMEGNAVNQNVTTATLGKTTFAAEAITANKVLPGWSETKTMTLTLTPGDQDVDFVCYVNASALSLAEGAAEGETLKDFYITTTATPANSNTVSGLVTKKKFATADKDTDVVIASGTLKGGMTTDNVQTISYTIGFDETGVDQDAQQGATFASSVQCRLASKASYYNNENPTGTDTKPDAQ